PNGSAPGLRMDHKGKLIVLLPGPPRENQPMFDGYIFPELEKMSRGVRIAKRFLKVVGLGESAMDDMIAPIYTEYSDITTTVLFTDTEIEVHLIAAADNVERAQARVDELAEKLEEKLDQFCYSSRGETFEEVIGNRMRLKGYTLATAESCTGGI